MTDHQRSLRVLLAESLGGTGTPVDCVLMAHDGTTVRELVERGVDGGLWPAPREPWVARAPRSGRHAEADEPLALLGLAHGDLVELHPGDRTLTESPAPAGAQPGTPELAVVSGPAAGRRIALDGRAVVVGRDAACDLALDDRSLSLRHLRVDPGSGGWILRDLGSSNGTAVDGALIGDGASVVIAEGAEIEAGRSVLALRRAPAPAAIDARPDGAQVGVNRPPRMTPGPLGEALEAPEVPDRPRGPRLPVITSLVPLLGGVVMWQLLDQLMFLAFTLLSPLMLIGSYVSDRLSGRADFKQAVARLRRDRERLRERREAVLAAERAERLERFPDAAELVRRVTGHDRRLWERRPHHLDHLALRVGLADQPSATAVRHGTRGDEALREELDRELPERATLVNAPVTVELAEVGVVGVVGPPAERAAVTRWLAVQLAALHSPRDVQLAAILGDEDAADWEWLKWLPHVRDSVVEQLGVSGIATRTLQISQLTGALGELQRERLAARRSAAARSGREGPDLVVLVEDGAVHDRAAMTEVLARAGESGVQVVWEASERHQLPGECRVIIEIDAARFAASVTDTATRAVLADVTLDGLAPALTEAVATALAPLRDVTQAERGIGALPPVAHLAELEGLAAPSAEAVLDRWARPQGEATFMLGAGPSGPLLLDFVEHGPHALIGGTPGAGKSELLRGMLASLALRYPPSRMTFLLIDFKGGAAFREFAGLPHTVGVVTDLDEHLAERALTSFRAEIKHREAVLEQHGAIDVLDLARRAPQVELPRLLIVIDEFATLAQEVPAFVDGVIDVTQRGRSLGVHLVLATQSPRGSVTGKIRANTNLAIALRTVSADESADILGTADAAAIPVQRKGRAWARIGDRDLVPFQSAYVGGSSFGLGGPETAVAPFRLGELAPGPAARAATAEATQTDLEAITAAIGEAFAQSGAPRPRAPWLPPLPELLAPAPGRSPGAFGRTDEPQRQRQAELVFDPAADGSLVVLGGPRSGKTSTLATIAGTLAEDRPVDALHVYGLDCAGRALAAIEGLPHCGAVVPGDDAERTTQLLAMLERTVQQRRDLASQLGVAEFEQLRQHAGEPLPRLLVLVDDYGGFFERYERVEAGVLVDRLRGLISDGPAFGVHFVLSADRRSAIPTSVAAAVPRRLIHRLADRDEYARAGLPARLADAQLPPGRAFTEDGVEAQVATWLESADDTLRAAIARRGERLGDPAGAAARPAPVAMLPALVRRTDGPAATGPWQAFLGLRETELRPLVIDLAHGNFVIAGSYRSGRSTALAAVAAGVLAGTPGAEAHLVLPRRSSAGGAAPWASVLRGGEHAPVVELFERLLDRADAGTPVLLAIDDATEVDPAGMSGLDGLLRQARDLPLRVVVAAEAQALRTSYSPWHVQLRKDGHGIVLNPNLELDGDLLGARFPWRREIGFPPGRGLYVDAGRWELVQVVGDAAAG